MSICTVKLRNEGMRVFYSHSRIGVNYKLYAVLEEHTDYIWIERISSISIPKYLLIDCDEIVLSKNNNYYISFDNIEQGVNTIEDVAEYSNYEYDSDLIINHYSTPEVTSVPVADSSSLNHRRLLLLGDN